MVVDPGGGIDEILAAVGGADAEVEAVLLTHAHIDHAGGVAELLERFERAGKRPPLMAHAAEREMRATISRQAAFFGLSPDEYRDCPEPDRYLEDGDTIAFGDLTLEVLFTPGHSPGHVALHYTEESQSVVLAGDTLFNGSIGRTDLPGGDHETLIQSIESKLLVLPEDTLVLPGHGPDTTIGAEKRNNPFLRLQGLWR